MNESQINAAAKDKVCQVITAKLAGDDDLALHLIQEWTPEYMDALAWQGISLAASMFIATALQAKEDPQKAWAQFATQWASRNP